MDAFRIHHDRLLELSCKRAGLNIGNQRCQGGGGRGGGGCSSLLQACDQAASMNFSMAVCYCMTEA